MLSRKDAADQIRHSYTKASAGGRKRQITAAAKERKQHLVVFVSFARNHGDPSFTGQKDIVIRIA